MRNFSIDSTRYQRLAQELIDAGIDVNIPNKNALTPLHLAFHFQQIEAIRFAIAYNLSKKKSVFDFNRQGKLGFSPLHWAVAQNNAQLQCMLIEYHQKTKVLDLSLRDDEGRIALDHCNNAFSSITKTLRRAMQL